MIALLLAAQVAAAAPAVTIEVHKTPGQRTASETPNLLREPGYCRGGPIRTVDRYWRLAPETLNKMPPASVELAVDRSIGGCRVRTVVRHVQDDGRFTPVDPRAPRREDGRSRKR